MMYQVIATVHVDSPDGYKASRQVPTFYLDSNVQGIVSVEHARTIARSVVLAAAADAATTAAVIVVPVPEVS